MNKLIVCGDSYMSPRVDYPGKHFSEIIAHQLGFELTVLSRSGISNGGIALQILEAIKHQPQLLLLNLTFYDRIEFRLDGFKDQRITFNSLDYSGQTTDVSTQSRHPGPLASENLATLLNGSHYPKSKHDAIKHYFEELYCEDWKRQTDYMMIYAVLHTLHKSTIPYIIIQDNLQLNCNHPCNIDWIHEKNTIAEQTVQFFSRPKEFDPGFHTSLETQKDVAQFVLNHYDKYFR